MSLEFQWDATKAAENTKKHGVTFDEALTVFADPLARIFDDPDHSSDEHREIAPVGCLFHGTRGQGSDYQRA